MSGAHTHSAEDMRSLSHLMAIVHVLQLEKKKWKHRTLLQTFTKTSLPKEVDENKGIYMADKHLFYVQNVHCTWKRAVTSSCQQVTQPYINSSVPLLLIVIKRNG